MEGFKLQMTDVGNEVKANTRLTEDIHGKTDEMFQLCERILVPADRGLALLNGLANFLGKVGRTCVRAVEFLGRLAKPLFWLAAAGAGLWTWWKTGSWHMPDWWNWFQ